MSIQFDVLRTQELRYVSQSAQVDRLISQKALFHDLARAFVLLTWAFTGGHWHLLDNRLLPFDWGDYILSSDHLKCLKPSGSLVYRLHDEAHCFQLQSLIDGVQIELLAVPLGKLHAVISQVILLSKLLLWVGRYEHYFADDSVKVFGRH